MTFDELYQKHNGHWVAIKVTKRDEGGQPVEFDLVATDIDFYESRKQMIKGEEYCVLYAGNIPENDLTVMY